MEDQMVQSLGDLMEALMGCQTNTQRYELGIPDGAALEKSDKVIVGMPEGA